MSVSASVEVAALARLPVQLDERDLDLGMPVGARVGVAAEHLVDQVGEATGDREESLSPVARADATPAWMRWPAQ